MNGVALELLKVAKLVKAGAITDKAERFVMSADHSFSLALEGIAEVATKAKKRSIANAITKAAKDVQRLEAKGE